MGLKEAVVLASGDPMGHKFFLGDLDPLCWSDKQIRAIDNVSTNTISVIMTGKLIQVVLPMYSRATR